MASNPFEKPSSPPPRYFGDGVYAEPGKGPYSAAPPSSGGSGGSGGGGSTPSQGWTPRGGYTPNPEVQSRPATLTPAQPASANLISQYQAQQASIPLAQTLPSQQQFSGTVQEYRDNVLQKNMTFVEGKKVATVSEESPTRTYEYTGKGETYKVDVGGKTITASPTSYQETQKGENYIYDASGEIVGVESAALGRTVSIKEYNRLAEVSPQAKYFEPSTGKTFETSQILEPTGKFTTTPYKVYVNPKTGLPIEDINAYVLENKIPTKPREPITTIEQLDAAISGKGEVYSIGKVVGETSTGKIYSGIPEKYLTQEQIGMKRENEFGNVLPITSSDIFTLVGGGMGLIKGGLLTGAQIVLSGPIIKTAEYILPKPTNTGFALSGLTGQAIRTTAILATLPLTGVAYSFDIGKNLLTNPIETTKSIASYTLKNPYEVVGVTIGGLATARLRTEATQISLFGRKPYQVMPSEELKMAVEPFTRQRATVMLKEESTGKYILGKTKGGEIISIGGGIEKGQTPRVAALAELKQETGLTLNDVANFKFAKKIVTPEETFHVFTGTIKNIKQIKAASDINKIVTISPKNLFIRGVTGQTSIQPVSRLSLYPLGRIRSYEAGIINYLETGKEPTWLAIQTAQGEYYLGTQSRYNVPFSSQKRFLEQEELLLAHGTSNPAVLRKLLTFKEKTFQVLGAKTKRGQAEGLYVQPPISAVKTSSGYIALSYLGFKTSQLIDFGVKIANPKRTAYLFKEKPNGAIVPTPKTFSGMEVELIINPKADVSTIGRATTASIGLKRVYLQPTRISKQGESTFGKGTLEISSKEGYSYLSPSTVVSSFYYPSSTRRIIYRQPSKNSLVPIESKSKKIELSRGENAISIAKVNESNASNGYYGIENVPSYTPYLERVSVNASSLTPSHVKLTSIIPSPIRPFKEREERKKQTLRQISVYNVLLRKRGKFLPVATGLSKGQALRFGSQKAITDIARTFKISQAGTKEIFGSEEDFMPSEKLFRGYIVRRGKRISTPNQFTQLTSANLQSGQEKWQIAEAKRLKKLGIEL